MPFRPSRARYKRLMRNRLTRQKMIANREKQVQKIVNDKKNGIIPSNNRPVPIGRTNKHKKKNRISDIEKKNEQALKAFSDLCKDGYCCLHHFQSKLDKIDGFNVNIVHNGETPLMIACRYRLGHVASTILKDCDKSLLRKKDKNGRNALMICCDVGMSDVMEELLKYNKHFRLYDVDNRGRTALIIACSVEGLSEDAILRMMTYSDRLGINVVCKDRSTAIMWAASRKKNRVVKKILGCGVDLNLGVADDANGSTALIYCANQCDSEVTLEMISRMTKREINILNKFGNSALTFACRNGRSSVIEELLKVADDNVMKSVNEERRTVFGTACGLSSCDSIHSILDRGDVYGMDLIDKANDRGYYPLTNLVSRCFTNLAMIVLNKMIESDKLDVLRHKMIYDRTIVYFAIRNGSADLIDRLLELPDQYIDLGLCANDETALMFALQQDKPHLARKFIRYPDRCMINYVDSGGHSALSYTVKSISLNNITMTILDHADETLLKSTLNTLNTRNGIINTMASSDNIDVMKRFVERFKEFNLMVPKERSVTLYNHIRSETMMDVVLDILDADTIMIKLTRRSLLTHYVNQKIENHYLNTMTVEEIEAKVNMVDTLNGRLDKINREKECMMCCDDTKSHVLFNKCKHVVTICESCTNDLRYAICPVCMVRTEHTAGIFIV